VGDKEGFSIHREGIMPNVDKKVVAAIAGALGLYFQEEQRAAAAMQQMQPAPAPPPAPAQSPWAMAGRQASMEMRRMWQMRLVR
jgi:hypothetical protein